MIPSPAPTIIPHGLVAVFRSKISPIAKQIDTGKKIRQVVDHKVLSIILVTTLGSLMSVFCLLTGNNFSK